MIYLRQSTAGQEVPLGYFVDSTDGDTEETALTISNTDIKIWKFGATSLANKNSGGATHMSNGIYYCILDATDTNTLGSLVIFIHETGALTVRLECVVLTAINYDSLIAGSDYQQVDLLQIGGDTQSAIDLKDFADAGYDPSVNKVEGVKLADVCTANTDVRGTDNAATEVKQDIIDGNVDSILIDIGNLNDISVADIIAGIADGTYDFQEMMRIIFASVSGKSTNNGTRFRDAGDSKDRIVATLDANKNRTVVVRDGS